MIKNSFCSAFTRLLSHPSQPGSLNGLLQTRGRQLVVCGPLGVREVPEVGDRCSRLLLASMSEPRRSPRGPVPRSRAWGAGAALGHPEALRKGWTKKVRLPGQGRDACCQGCGPHLWRDHSFHCKHWGARAGPCRAGGRLPSLMQALPQEVPSPAGRPSGKHAWHGHGRGLCSWGGVGGGVSTWQQRRGSSSC